MSFQRRHSRELLVDVDRTDPATLARQVEEQLRSIIGSGSLPAGSRLPSSRSLAEDIGVSRGVISRAYTQLAFEGYIRLKQGSTPTVSHVNPVQRTPADDNVRLRVRYDVRGHLPDVSMFPRTVWLRSVQSSLHRASDADLSYGDYSGLRELRVELTGYLARARGVAVEPGRIVITNGSTHSLALISRMLARSGRTEMAFENPSHFLLREVARAAGQEIFPVPVDEGGLVVGSLADATAVVVSPAHQFPLGVTLSPRRRDQLVAWAAETGGLIIEDDYGSEFRYDRAPSPALQSSSPEHVIYVGSTSKTFAPALRLGWVVLPDDLCESFAGELGASILNVSGFNQLALADFVRAGEFDRHVRRMRDVYRKRRDVLVGVLNEQLPGFSIRGNAAGLHVFVEMPSHELSEAVRLRAIASGVEFETISQHAAPGYNGPAGLILGFGAVPEPGLEIVAGIIAEAIRIEQPSVARCESAA